jgi:uncharacterized membrane protein YqiK
MFGLSVPVMAGLLVLAILFAMAGFATLLRKVGPHEALIVYGIRGPRTVTNGGTILIPMPREVGNQTLIRGFPNRET